MLGANSDGILIGCKTMGYLSTNSYLGKRVHCVVIGCIEGITFVVPVSSINAHHIMHQQKGIHHISQNMQQQISSIEWIFIK
jgi:hypothetical protein